MTFCFSSILVCIYRTQLNHKKCGDAIEKSCKSAQPFPSHRSTKLINNACSIMGLLKASCMKSQQLRNFLNLFFSTKKFYSYILFLLFRHSSYSFFVSPFSAWAEALAHCVLSNAENPAAINFEFKFLAYTNI